MTNTKTKSEAIDSVAEDYRDLSRKLGNEITFDEARRRVALANRRGDLKRDNGNR